MARVSLRNISKIYQNSENGKRTPKMSAQSVAAVQDLCLDIQDGEFIVLVGPSGCGKSTTLRMIAGLEEITSGELYIGDRLMNDVAPKDRDIAMVFQNYALYPHMTAYENMAFSLKLKGMPKAEIDRKVRETAEMLDIAPYLGRKPKELSGGQRQRVAIGRAIVRDPAVFLMDEPLSNLDAKLRNQMRAEIIKLRRRIDTTFIYVTHDQTEAMTLGDRIVVMKGGIIQQTGTPQEVFSHPANLFVAGFIGTPQMNLFDARLGKDGEGYFAELDGEKIPLPEEKQAALRETGEQPRDVTLGIRPEHLMLCPEGIKGQISAAVEVSEMMGSSVHLHANANGRDIVAIIPIDPEDGTQRLFCCGSRVSFTFSGGAIHLFDKQTEKSII